MGSSEDLAGRIRKALRHPKADLLFEIGLEEPTPTQAARAARAQGLSNEEEKLAKWIAVFKRDYGAGWFRALREIIETTESENPEMGLTKTQRKALENIKPENVQEAVDILMNRSGGSEFITLKSAFDPQKVKREHLEKLGLHDSWVPGDGSTTKMESGLLSALGMTIGEVLESIPDPEPGHENYLLVVNCLPLGKLMKFVVVDGKRGKSSLNENKIEDVIEVPKTLFYWRYDIEKLEEEEDQLTAREVVCFVIRNQDTFRNRRIWAFGSSYGSACAVPYVFFSPGDQPDLRSDAA